MSENVVEETVVAAEHSVAAPVERRVEQLLHLVNSIDKGSLDAGKPLIKEVWQLEKRGMWKKGQAIIALFPELEEAVEKPNKGGRPRKGEERAISFRWVSERIGRPEPTVIRWVKFFLSVGKTEDELSMFLATAAQAAVESWERKLVKSDATPKDPEPDERKRIDSETFANVRDRVDSGEQTEADVRWLLARVERLTATLHKVLQLCLDEKPDRAIKAIEDALDSASEPEAAPRR